MNLIIGETYFHTRRKIRVVLLNIYTGGYVRVKDEDGESFNTLAIHLQEINGWSLEEILKREG